MLIMPAGLAGMIIMILSALLFACDGGASRGTRTKLQQPVPAMVGLKRNTVLPAKSGLSLSFKSSGLQVQNQKYQRSHQVKAPAKDGRVAE